MAIEARKAMWPASAWAVPNRPSLGSRSCTPREFKKAPETESNPTMMLQMCCPISAFYFFISAFPRVIGRRMKAGECFRHQRSDVLPHFSFLLFHFPACIARRSIAGRCFSQDRSDDLRWLGSITGSPPNGSPDSFHSKKTISSP